MHSNATLEPTYSVADLVEWSGVGESFWRREINTKKLRGIRIGTTVRVLKADLETYLEEHVKEGPDPRGDPRRHTRAKPKS